jgi:DNA modification methylase
MEVRCTYDKLVPIAELKAHPKNRNKHPKSQLERLAEILEYQGWRYPVKVSKRSGHVTSGHGRIEAARLNGWTDVPVNFQDYADDTQEYADVQSDNAIASWAELDLGQILDDLKGLPNLNIDLLGIKNFKLPEILEGKGDPDAIPEATETRAKPGDIWRLGNHRLMCGDSTQIHSVLELMGGKLADLWLTDPPYGVSYRSNGAEEKHREIENDNKPLEEMKVFWAEVATAAFAACSDKSAYYWFACQGGDQMMMMMSLGAGGWQVKHELMWLKNTLVMGRCDYHYKHEPILYGWKRGGTHRWFGDRKQTSVLEFPKPASSDLHPTMKPIELLEPLINNSTESGQKVLDLFGGSGSTLIACEKTNRKCFMMELDPKYCDVILTRWEEYTGQKAELLNGQSQ